MPNPFPFIKYEIILRKNYLPHKNFVSYDVNASLSSMFPSNFYSCRPKKSCSNILWYNICWEKLRKKMIDLSWCFTFKHTLLVIHLYLRQFQSTQTKMAKTEENFCCQTSGSPIVLYLFGKFLPANNYLETFKYCELSILSKNCLADMYCKNRPIAL